MDLSTRYLGMTLKNPIVPSASPLSRTLEGIRRLEDAGAGAVVMPSLFEEQINQGHHLDYYLSYSSGNTAEALRYFPDMDTYAVDPDTYLEVLRKAKESVDIPIIGSLNGVSSGGWMNCARLMEQAGADALEMNLYYVPTDPYMSGIQVDLMYLDAVRRLRNSVRIPIAVKISPYFSSLAYLARCMVEEGADGLVMFNRFYQPDFDLDAREVQPHLVLSRSEDLRLPLRWTAILYGRIPIDFAITSGIHDYQDALKAIMAGANVVMMASELLRNGVQRIGEITQDITQWLEKNGYDSLTQVHGSMSQRRVAEPAAFERANYMKELQSFIVDPAEEAVAVETV